MNAGMDELAPVRAALLRRATARAARVSADAAAETDRRIGEARAQADAVRTAAERAGRARGQASGAAAVAAAGRDARRLVLRSHRDAYVSLRAAVRDRLAADPRLPETFAARIRAVLGDDATLTAVPGGVRGVRGERRMECTVDALADAALDRLGPAVRELWSP